MPTRRKRSGGGGRKVEGEKNLKKLLLISVCRGSGCCCFEGWGDWFSLKRSMVTKPTCDSEGSRYRAARKRRGIKVQKKRGEITCCRVERKRESSCLRTYGKEGKGSCSQKKKAYPPLKKKQRPSQRLPLGKKSRDLLGAVGGKICVAVSRYPRTTAVTRSAQRTPPPPQAGGKVMTTVSSRKGNQKTRFDHQTFSSARAKRGDRGVGGKERKPYSAPRQMLHKKA